MHGGYCLLQKYSIFLFISLLWPFEQNLNVWNHAPDLLIGKAQMATSEMKEIVKDCRKR